MTLGVTGEEIKMNKNYEETINSKEEKPEIIEDVMAPKLVEETVEKPSVVLFEPVQKNETSINNKTVENNSFVLNTVPETAPELVFGSISNTKANSDSLKINTSTTNAFLAKPNNIYIENANAIVEKTEPKPLPQNVIELSLDVPIIENNHFEETEELPAMEMVIKNENVEPNIFSIHDENNFEPINNNTSIEEQEEDSLTKSAERTKKLRNLSFNFDNLDANVYDNEPAYLRRKNEIHQTLANVEKFYSNYTVSVDENNEAKINTNSKNSFLEGDRPD
jgi:hypothetical protein